MIRPPRSGRGARMAPSRMRVATRRRTMPTVARPCGPAFESSASRCRSTRKQSQPLACAPVAPNAKTPRQSPIPSATSRRRTSPRVCGALDQRERREVGDTGHHPGGKQGDDGDEEELHHLPEALARLRVVGPVGQLVVALGRGADDLEQEPGQQERDEGLDQEAREGVEQRGGGDRERPGRHEVAAEAAERVEQRVGEAVGAVEAALPDVGIRRRGGFGVERQRPLAAVAAEEESMAGFHAVGAEPPLAGGTTELGRAVGVGRAGRRDQGLQS